MEVFIIAAITADGFIARSENDRSFDWTSPEDKQFYLRQIKRADAIIMGSPTYMGSVSWQFKKFADASSKPWFSQQWKDKLAAGFTNSAGMNGDKLSTLHYLFTLSMQHGMIWVSQGLMPSNTKAAQRDDVNYLVSYSGAIAQSPSDASANEMLPGDLETARLFGERVAEVAAKFKG